MSEGRTTIGARARGRVVGAGVVACLAMAACSSGDDAATAGGAATTDGGVDATTPATSPSSDGATIVTSAEPTVDTAAPAVDAAAPAVDAASPDDASTGSVDGLVQDLVVLHRYAVIRADGERDLVPDLVDAIVSDEPTVTALADGVSFAHGGAVTAHAVDPDGDRDDVEVTVGVVDDGESRTLAAVLTPTGERPITVDDTIVLDLTASSEALADGDLISMDVSFDQAYPTEDEPDDPIERLAARIAAGELAYLAAPGPTSADGAAADVDGAPDEAVFTGVLGEVRTSGAPLGLVRTGRQAEPSPAGTAPGKPRQPQGADVMKGLTSCRGLGLKCVSSHLKNLRKKVVPSASSYIDKNTRPVPDPTPEPVPMPSGPSAQSWGDPHVRTFDGDAFDLMAVGELWFARTDDLDVQLRTEAIGDSISVVAAVGVGLGGHRVHVDRASVVIDGEALDDQLLDVEVGDVRITAVGSQVTVSDGASWVRVDRGQRAMDVVVVAPGAPSGLAGDADGDPDDDAVGPAGEIPEGEPGSPAWQRSLADLWRIEQADSRFHYLDGESTETFTDRALPVDAAPVEGAARARAELACEVGGVTDPVLVEMCVLDVATLGLGAVRSFDLPSAVAATASAGAAAEPPDGETGGPTDLDASWDETAEGRWPGIEEVERDRPTFDWTCLPAGDDTTVLAGPLWGTGTYTADSSICVAAVHAGRLDASTGGEVTVRLVPPLDRYEGTTANGVTSGSWGSWPRAFELVDGP